MFGVVTLLRSAAASVGEQMKLMAWLPTTLAAAGLSLTACQSKLVVGSLDAEDTSALPTALPTVLSPLDAQAPSVSEPMPVDAAVMPDAGAPWTTSFEDGFSDYEAAGGECFASPASSFELVTSPVHSGSSAAAFRIAADGTEEGFMAHCVRYGELPEAAVYGAWFYIPTELMSAFVWAVMHFDGEGGDLQHELWDVRIELDPDGFLRLRMFDYLRMETLQPETGGEVPVGAWFHVEVYLKRAADVSGALSLYLDGTELLSVNNLVTDDATTSEFYVGNFAALTMPRPNTVYVDDVTISTERQGGN